MSRIPRRIILLCALASLLCITNVQSPALADQWADYENPSTGGLTQWSGYSTDPRVESRRTDHFLIRYGHERQEGLLVEQVAQGHLQYLENCYDTWCALGFTPGLGGTGTTKYRSVLHVAKTFPGDPTGPVGATGFGEGGASGACVPTSYLGYRDGNGATPHEFGHGWGTNLPSFFSESVANWIEQQAIVGYPGDWISVGMPMAHAANYYNNLSIFNYFMEAPGYGAPFLMKLFYEPNLNGSNPALDDIIRKAIRCDTSGAVDKAGAIHDGLGMMNAKMLDIDFWNKRFNNLDGSTKIRAITYDMDLNRQGFHFSRIPMVRQPGVTGTWYRPEFSMIPQMLSNNFIPLTVTAVGSPRTISCDFRPVADAVRGTSFRACFVAFNKNKEPRYSSVWNVGEKSFTLADDETAVYLAIIACPYALNTNLQHNDYTTDNVAMFPYRISLNGATPKGWQWPSPAAGTYRIHSNGGGKVANTATVAASAYVGPNAMVMGSAKVYGNARIEDYAYVDGSAVIGRSGTSDDPVVSGHAYVSGTAQVYGHGKVRDYGWVFGSSKVYENGIVMSHSVVNGAQVFGNGVINQTSVRDAGLCYSGSISGCAIIGGDTSGGSNFDKGVFCEYPGLSVLDNAYQYLGHNFEKKSCVFAMDQYGMNHSYLMGEPQVLSATINGVTTNVLNLDGTAQYIELRPDAVDFPDMTISTWVKWSGSANNQIIFSCGDGNTKYMSLTPKASATGFLQFAICDGTNTQYLNGTAALTNAWTHVALTLSGNTGTLYINGLQVAQNTSMTIDPDKLYTEGTPNANFIGRNNAGNYFAGRIDEFKVFNKALSAAEVLTLSGVVTGGAAGAADTAAPTPTTATWLVVPTVLANHTITMSATEGRDAGGNGVLYYFRCVNDPTHDSGWISENKYTDCKADPGTTYTYAVKMKDKKGNTGTESVQLSATAAAADITAPAPNAPTFSAGPKGTSGTAISMTATKGVDDDETILYKFTRVQSPSPTSGWTSSRTWTDTGLTAGSSYTYTLQMKDGHGNMTAVTTSAPAVAGDDTPPAMDADFRLQWAILPHTQLDRTVRMCVTEPVETAVDYYYECVETSTINSGWTSSRTWVTPPMPDGIWSFRFKMRDRSAKLNESGWSVAKTAKILATNSYHTYTMAQLAALPNSTLVQFSGKVTQVNAGSYQVTSADGLTSITVVPRSYYTATDALLLNKNVDVKGHLWTYAGTPKRVTEAFVRGNPQSGKIELENCEYTDEHWALRTDSGASGLECLGGFPFGYSVTIPNVAATAQMTVCYRGGGGAISLYVNGTHSKDLTLPNLSTWGKAVFTGLTIPAGATLKFQRDTTDAQMDLDYVIVGPVYPVSGKVTSSAGGSNISGATVYFSDLPNASTNPLAATATTDAFGNYSYPMRDGTWYVCAAKVGYNTSADQIVVVNGGARANVNFALVPNVTVAGKVTNKSGGGNISGASVYFAASPGGVPAYAATTNATGDFSQSIQNGTWYVHAGKSGVYPTFERVIVVNGVALTGVNFQLEPKSQTIPQTDSLYFYVTPESFTAAEGAQTGNWQLQYLDGVNVSADPSKYAVTGGSPSMEVRGAIKWERNKYDDMEGYEVQNRSLTPILPFNGGTFVAVIKPTLRPVEMGYGGQYILNVGYNGQKGFAIVMLNDTGQIRIIRNGNWYNTNVFIPDGQKTVLTCVIQPNGSFVMYANGIQVYTQTATSSFVNVDLSNNAFYQQKVSIGEGAIWLDGSACYNGNIGDVMVYYAPLSDTDRTLLESHLMKKFAISGITINSTAGEGGMITPSGNIAVASGSNQTFNITPDTGYAIQSVTVDGVSQGAISTYTFTNVTADHTISATFRAVSVRSITASAGAGGSITPSGSVNVTEGYSQTFEITPHVGYTINDVLVDGVSVGSVSSYTFNNVVANHTISVTFNAQPVTVTGKVTDQSNGSAIAGASVYFSTSASPSAHPAYTATTDASGNYSQVLPVGTWYAAAGKTGYDTSADKTIVVTPDSPPVQNFEIARPPVAGIDVSYKFDETSGTTAADSAGTAENGTLMNGPVWASGRVNNCLSFDGTNDYVSVPNLGDYGAITIAGWINLDTLGTDATASSILSCDGTDAGDIQFSILKSGGKMRFSLIGNTPADNDSTYAFTSADVGKWRHVAVVYDSAAKTVKFYINGGLNATKTLTTTRVATLSNGVRVGSYSTGRYFDGKIDEFNIYGRALSASEIAAVVNSTGSMKIAEAKKLANGELVTLPNKMVIYAPRNASNARCTTYFYVEEPDKTAGLLVFGSGAITDNLSVDTGASIAGFMRTISATGQRYLELSAIPTSGMSNVVTPLGMTTKSLHTDPSVPGLLVRVTGKVLEVSPDGDWFTISDGYRANGSEVLTLVISETGIPVTGITVGDVVCATGASWKDQVFSTDPEGILYLRSVVKL